MNFLWTFAVGVMIVIVALWVFVMGLVALLFAFHEWQEYRSSKAQEFPEWVNQLIVDTEIELEAPCPDHIPEEWMDTK